jgi:hypothetical protein
MGSIMLRSIRVAATALVWLILPLVELVMAQPSATAPAPPAASDRNSPAYTLSDDLHLTIRPDLMPAIDTIRRIKILRESAIATLGQQSLSYAESYNPTEVVEAYTEKADGRRIAVDQAHILTRDAATGLNATYQRDARVKTLIFPDIEVGDTRGSRRSMKSRA